MKKSILVFLGAFLLLGSLYFFYQAALFLEAQDYIAGLLFVFVGLSVLKTGIELEKLAVLSGGVQ
jgi:putative Mn2+ efflux pump MntP